MKRKFLLMAMLSISLVILGAVSIGNATIFRFDADPFGPPPNALDTPGRQIVGGEAFISFDIASDVFQLVTPVFNVENKVFFANDVVSNLPTSGVNTIVLQTIEDPFAAGIAANLIAAQITSPRAGFFIYFNTGLDLPRLVYSTDLDDNQADLKVLARMINLTGQSGRDALATFTAANFEIVPLPGTFLLMGTGLAGFWLRRRFMKN